jgi:hypothetical protein
MESFKIDDNISNEELAEISKEIKGKGERPKEIDLIINQWIPDTEKAINEIKDVDRKEKLTEKLEKIKDAIPYFDDADFNDEKVVEQATELYERAEKLFGDAVIEEEKED